MPKYVHLENHDQIKYAYDIVSYLYPEFVLIPYNDKENIVINQPAVLKNDLIAKNPYEYASVSGKVLKNTEIELNGQSQNCLVIANDFMEKAIKKKSIKKNGRLINKVTFLALLMDFSLEILRNEFTNDNNFLCVQCYADEKGHNINELLIMQNPDEFLETIDDILRINNLKEAKLLVKNSNNQVVNCLINRLGTYPKITIELLPNYYPLCASALIDPLLHLKRAQYALVNAIGIFDIYGVLTYRLPIIEKMIVLTGDALEKPQIIFTKKGVLLQELMDHHLNFAVDNYHVIAHSLLTGYEINPQTTIVDQYLEIVYFMKPELYEKEPCIKCGRCNEVCPMGINVYQGLKKKVNIDKCLQCNLCSYVCPAHINLLAELEKRSKDEK